MVKMRSRGVPMESIPGPATVLFGTGTTIYSLHLISKEPAYHPLNPSENSFKPQLRPGELTIKLSRYNSKAYSNKVLICLFTTSTC
jgi:hypothetical protein